MFVVEPVVWTCVAVRPSGTILIVPAATFGADCAAARLGASAITPAISTAMMRSDLLSISRRSARRDAVQPACTDAETRRRPLLTFLEDGAAGECLEWTRADRPPYSRSTHSSTVTLL